MYGEARLTRHVTCQYSYSSMKKFVQLVKIKKKRFAKNGRFGEKNMRVEKKERDRKKDRKKERERERERERVRERV